MLPEESVVDVYKSFYNIDGKECYCVEVSVPIERAFSTKSDYYIRIRPKFCIYKGTKEVTVGKKTNKEATLKIKIGMDCVNF